MDVSSAVAPRYPSRLVDQHGHPVAGGGAGLGVFERQLAIAATGSPAGRAGAGTFFDSRSGLSVLRWCPPLLGLEPHCSPAAYLARRRALGAHAVLRRLLGGSGIGGQLLAPAPAPAPDEPPTEIATAAERSVAPGPVAELTVLEALVTQLAATTGCPSRFLRHLTDAVHQTAVATAAFVCDAAPLADTPTACYDPLALRQAAARRLAAARQAVRGGLAGRGTRCSWENTMAEPLLLQHLLREALATGRPVQLRCPNPLPLAGLLRAMAGRGALILLPDPPHHRAAARLAAILPDVYADVGPYPAETLSEAPFGKLLFTTRAGLLPELRVVRAREFRRRLDRLLSGWVADGDCPVETARSAAARIGGNTARWLYGLPHAG